jgi:hypothetical protein
MLALSQKLPSWAVRSITGSKCFAWLLLVRRHTFVSKNTQNVPDHGKPDLHFFGYRVFVQPIFSCYQYQNLLLVLSTKVGIFVCFLGFFFAGPADGQNQRVSPFRAKPTTAARFMGVENNKTKLLQSIDVAVGFIEGDFQRARNLISVQPINARWTGQQLENLNQHWVYLSLLLLSFFLLCAKPLYLRVRRLQLDLKIAKLRFECFYFSFLLDRRLAVLKRLRHDRERRQTVPDLGITRSIRFWKAKGVKKIVDKDLESLTGGHIACEPKPNLKQ